MSQAALLTGMYRVIFNSALRLGTYRVIRFIVDIIVNPAHLGVRDLELLDHPPDGRLL